MDIKNQAYYDGLLSQYIDGTISEANRFILEKRALDDPFLFESLEGFQNKEGNYTKTIKELRSKVDEQGKEKKTKRIPFYNYGIAASLILLLGAGLWFFTDTMNSQENIALNTKTESTASGSDRELIPSPDANDEITMSQDIDNSNQYDSPKAIISQSDNEEELSASRSSSPPPTKEKPQLESIVVTKQEQLPEPAPSYRKAKSETAEPSTNILTENPIQENEGMAIVESKNADSESASDAGALNTEFKNEAPSAKLNAQRVSEQLLLAREEYIMSLDEKTLVAPQEGITAFMKSISTKSKKLRQAEENSFEEVVVQFKLNEEGTPSNFEIISGENQDCINNIIAILKYQGNWITSPPRKKVGVQLTLPCQ